MNSTKQDVELSLVSLERGENGPALAWAAVAVNVYGVELIIHGISIVRDGHELVCRTPHHMRDKRWTSSIELPSGLANAIGEFVFSAYRTGVAVPSRSKPLPMSMH